MKTSLMIIALAALVFLAAMPAQAQTITMSNPGGIAERDIAVYCPNGSTAQKVVVAVALLP